MKVYLGKDRQHTAQHVTATHATVTELTRKIGGRGHTLCMDSFISSPELFDDMANKQFTVVALSDRTGEACHKTEDNRTEKGRHSRKNQG